ncbi:MAG: Flp pilus assembly protein CpaB [Christensenellales bacterium]
MKLLKNRLVIGALCIITALLLSFFALPALQGGNQNAYINAVRMKQPVQAGTQLTAEMLETVSVPEKLVEGGVRDIPSAAGKYTATDLYTGDYLTAAKLSATLAEQDSFSAGTPKGKMVVSITLPSLASGVSGRLKPGDIVTVMALPKGSVNQSLGVEPETDGDDLSGTVIYPELQYIEVCMVAASDGADASVAARPDKDAKNSLPITISFYATEEQALRLAEIENQSIIHLAFVARGAAASEFLPERVLSEGVTVGTEVE